MTRAEIIGRVLFQTDFMKADAILTQYRPMLRKPSYVEQIYNAVQSVFPDESHENRRLIFIATVYQVYQPLSFLEDKTDRKAQGKLPAGVRDEMARCLEFVNPEMINHHKAYVEPQMKPEDNGVQRPFKAKVMSIVERFKCYSINASDTQYQLSL